MSSVAGPSVETYRLVASNGRHIRMATQVRYPDGEVVRFIDRVSKREALRQAEVQRHGAR